MRLTKRIQLEELQAEQARREAQETMREFRQLLRQRLASRTALALGFAGGMALGWWRTKHKAAPSKAAPVKRARGAARQSLPPHWLGKYVVWPFLLATARDFVVSRRPSSEQQGGTGKLQP